MKKSIPTIRDYSRNYFMDKIQGRELQVGDVVYYLAPSTEYAIRKSTIMAKKELAPNHHFRPLGACKLTLADGTVVDYDKVFDRNEEAMDYVIANLKSSLTHHRIGLQTIQNEIEKEERLLKIFEKRKKS
jgi:hypothetical protein